MAIELSKILTQATARLQEEEERKRREQARRREQEAWHAEKPAGVTSSYDHRPVPVPGPQEPVVLFDDERRDASLPYVLPDSSGQPGQPKTFDADKWAQTLDGYRSEAARYAKLDKDGTGREELHRERIDRIRDQISSQGITDPAEMISSTFRMTGEAIGRERANSARYAPYQKIPDAGAVDKQFFERLDTAVQGGMNVKISSAEIYRRCGKDLALYRQIMQFYGESGLDVRISPLGDYGVDDEFDKTMLYSVHKDMAPDRPEVVSLEMIRAFHGDDSAKAASEAYMKNGDVVTMNLQRAREIVQPNQAEPPPYVYFVEPTDSDEPTRIIFNRNYAFDTAKKGNFKISAVPWESFQVSPEFKEIEFPVRRTGETTEVFTANRWYEQMPGFHAIGRYGKTKVNGVLVPNSAMSAYALEDKGEAERFRQGLLAHHEIMAKTTGYSIPTGPEQIMREQILAENEEAARMASSVLGFDARGLESWWGVGPIFAGANRLHKRLTYFADQAFNFLSGRPLGATTVDPRYYGSAPQEYNDLMDLAVEFYDKYIGGKTNTRMSELIARNAKNAFGVAMDVLPFIPVVGPTGRVAFPALRSFIAMNAVDDTFYAVHKALKDGPGFGILSKGADYEHFVQRGLIPFQSSFHAANKLVEYGLRDGAGVDPQTAEDLSHVGGFLLFSQVMKAEHYYKTHKIKVRAEEEYRQFNEIWKEANGDPDLIGRSLLNGDIMDKTGKTMRYDAWNAGLTALMGHYREKGGVKEKGGKVVQRPSASNVFPSTTAYAKYLKLAKMRNSVSEAYELYRRDFIERAREFEAETVPDPVVEPVRDTPEGAVPESGLNQIHIVEYGKGIGADSVVPEGAAVAQTFAEWSVFGHEKMPRTTENERLWLEKQVEKIGERAFFPANVLEEMFDVARRLNDEVLASNVMAAAHASEHPQSLKAREIWQSDTLPTYKEFIDYVEIADRPEVQAIWARSLRNRVNEALERKQEINVPDEAWKQAEEILREQAPDEVQSLVDARNNLLAESDLIAPLIREQEAQAERDRETAAKAESKARAEGVAKERYEKAAPYREKAQAAYGRAEDLRKIEDRTLDQHHDYLDALMEQSYWDSVVRQIYETGKVPGHVLEETPKIPKSKRPPVVEKFGKPEDVLQYTPLIWQISQNGKIEVPPAPKGRPKRRGKGGAVLPGAAPGYDGRQKLLDLIGKDVRLNDLLFTKKGGRSPDEVVSDHANLLNGKDLWEALADEVRAYRKASDDARKASTWERMQRKFLEDVFQQKNSDGSPRQKIDVRSLRAGDVLEVAGEHVDVVDVNPDGVAILESRKYGQTILTPNDRVYAVRRNTYEPPPEEGVPEAKGEAPDRYEMTWEDHDSLTGTKLGDEWGEYKVGSGQEFRLPSGPEVKIQTVANTKTGARTLELSDDMVESQAQGLSKRVREVANRAEARNSPENEGKVIPPEAAYYIASKIGGVFADIVVKRNAAELSKNVDMAIEGIMHAFSDRSQAKTNIRIGLSRHLAMGEPIMNAPLAGPKTGWAEQIHNFMRVLTRAIEIAGVKPENVIFDVLDRGPKGGGYNIEAFYRDPQYLTSILIHEVFHGETYTPGGKKSHGSAAGNLLDMVEAVRAELKQTFSPEGDIELVRDASGMKRIATSLDPENHPIDLVEVGRIADSIKSRHRNAAGGKKLTDEQREAMLDDFDLAMRARNWVSLREIRNQLVRVTEAISGQYGRESAGYREKDSELYAEFGAAYFSDRATVERLAPEALRLWENTLSRRENLQKIIATAFDVVSEGKMPQAALGGIVGGWRRMAENAVAKRIAAEDNKRFIFRAATRWKPARLIEGDPQKYGAMRKFWIHRQNFLRNQVKEILKHDYNAMREETLAKGGEWTRDARKRAEAFLGAKGAEVIDNLERIYHTHDYGFLYMDVFNRHVYKEAQKIPGVRFTDFDGKIYDLTGPETLMAWVLMKNFQTHRSSLINPRGITPETAAKAEADIRRQLGEENFDKLGQIWQAWRNLRHDLVFPLLREARTHNETVLKSMEDTEFYVPMFTAIDPKATPTVYRMIGNMGKDINNPIYTLPTHDMKLIEAAILNRAKMTFYDFIKRNMSQEFQRLIFDVNPHIPKTYRHGYTTMHHLLDGKRVEYDVPEIVSKVFDNKSFGDGSKILKMFSTANKPIRALQYAISLQWMFRNAWKDSLSTLKKNPEIGKHPVAYMGEWFRALKDVARYRLKGDTARAYDLVDAIKAGAITPKTSWAKILDPVGANGLERLLASYGEHLEGVTDKTLGTKTKEMIGLGVAFEKLNLKEKTNSNDIFDLLMAFGDISDMTTKLAGYRMLKQAGLRGHELAVRVRNHVGTPDFLASGTGQPLTNNAFMYSNIAKNGLMSAWEQAKKNPAHFALYQVLQSGPTILLAGMLFGLFGEDAQKEARKIYGHIPEHELKRKGFIIPLGDVGENDARGFYVGFDQDHEGQYIQEMMYDTVKYFGLLKSGRNPSLATAELADDLRALGLDSMRPWKLGGVSDALTSAIAYGAFRVNFKDAFGRPVISRRAEEMRDAGSWGPWLSDALQYGFETTGASKWLAPLPVIGDLVGGGRRTQGENIIKSPFNPVGGFMGMSDRGESEWAGIVADEQRYEDQQRNLSRRQRMMDHIQEMDGEYVEGAVDGLYGEMVQAGEIDPGNYTIGQFRYQYKQAMGRQSKFGLIANLARRESASERRAYIEAVLSDPAVSAAERQAFIDEGHRLNLFPKENEK